MPSTVFVVFLKSSRWCHDHNFCESGGRRVFFVKSKKSFITSICTARLSPGFNTGEMIQWCENFRSHALVLLFCRQLFFSNFSTFDVCCATTPGCADLLQDVLPLAACIQRNAARTSSVQTAWYQKWVLCRLDSSPLDLRNILYFFKVSGAPVQNVLIAYLLWFTVNKCKKRSRTALSWILFSCFIFTLCAKSGTWLRRWYPDKPALGSFSHYRPCCHWSCAAQLHTSRKKTASMLRYTRSTMVPTLVFEN